MKKQIFSIIILSSLIINFTFSQTMVDADKMYPFHDGLAAVQKGDKWGFIDTTGRMAINYRNDIYYNLNTGYGSPKPPIFSSGLCIVEKIIDDKVLYGYIDKTGKTVIDYNYNAAIPFQEGYAIVLKYKGTKKEEMLDPDIFEELLIDSLGTEHTVLFENKVVNLFNTNNKINRKYSITQHGIFVENQLREFNGEIKTAKYYHSEKFSDGLALIKAKNEFGQYKWGFINESGKMVIKNIYTNKPQSFLHGLSAVKNKDGTWGYIDKTGTVVIKPRFKTVFPFFGERALVKLTIIERKTLYDKEYYKYSSLCFISRDGEIIQQLGQYWLGKVSPTIGNEYFTLALFKDRHSRANNHLIFNNNGMPSGTIRGPENGKIQMYHSSFFNSKRSLVRIDDKQGFINEKGKIVILQGTSEF